MRQAMTVFAAVFFTAACAFAAEEGTSKAGRFAGMKVKSERPRIWLDAGKVAWLKAKTAGMSVDEVKAAAGTGSIASALLYVITGDEAAGREAVEAVVTGAGRGYSDGTAAIVYDWCHALLSESEKETLKGRLVEAAKEAIAFKRNWRSFHNGMHESGWTVASAAIAVSGDDPYGDEAIDYLRDELEDAMLTFETLFPDGECWEGLDYNRHVALPTLKTLMALETATGEDFLSKSEHFRNLGLFLIYSQKPDGLVLNINDNDWPFLGWWERQMMLMTASRYGDGYCQYFLNHCSVERFQTEGRNKWQELLWNDGKLAERALSELPLSRLFRGMGLVVARSGWGWDTSEGRSGDTWLAFRCGDYYGDHEHYDINSFQIYHDGELATDSGRYDPDWNHFADEKFGQSQLFNYYQRTIAHNTVLVYDPEEEFSMPVANDGGQRQLLFRNGKRNVPEDYAQGTFPSDDGVGTCDWATNPGRWETGDILAYRATKDFTYVCGDGAAAYSAHKVKSFTRQLLFVQPDMVVVFDRVVSTKPEYKKTWLLHSIEEPRIAEEESSVEITYGGGKLVCVPVLPEKATLAKVGGPGNEFLVGDKKYQAGLSSPVEPSELHYGEMPGAWRVEESPAEASAEDYFLNVLLLGKSGVADERTIRIIANDEKSVCMEVATPDGETARVAFEKGEVPQASITLKDGEKETFTGTLKNEIVLDEKRPE